MRTAKKDFREVADSESKLISTTADMDGAKALLREAGVSGGSFDLTVKDNEQDKAVAEAVARAMEGSRIQRKGQGSQGIAHRRKQRCHKQSL